MTLNIKKYICLLFCFCLFFYGKSQVIYNAYAQVTAITGSSVLTIANVNQVNHTFNANEFVIVMQMQDNVIGTNTTNISTFGDLGSIQNAGRYEVARISAITATSMTLTTTLANTYNVGANASVQVISFRKLSAAAFTTTNNITGLAWNGTVGGVIALEVGTVLTLAHSISANGLGFTGGAMNTPQFAATSCDPNYISAIGNRWAGKGEGIYKNTTAAWTGARGKILTGGGGGNDENSGGGGGGNYTAGGMGGPGYTGGASGCSPSVGGLGGLSLNSVISSNRIFMGGGGGSGHANNSVGTVGGAGGGIILLKTGTLTTTGTCAGISITANGVSANNAGNDGAGGGGAAGSIVMQVNSYSVNSTCTLNITSSGGNGGSAVTGATHSGGGGGGQGAIIFSSTQPTININAVTTAGTGGTSCTGCATSVNATSGGGTNNAGIISNTTTPLPIELLKFTANEINESVFLNWTTLNEKNTGYFVVEKSVDARSWENVARVTAAGNSVVRLNYKAIDEKPYKGISYYRLKTVDKDATMHYSDILVFDKLNENPYSIYPNPSDGKLNLKIRTFSGSEPIHIIIYDALGKIVFEKIIQIEDGKYDYDFITLLKDGVYTIRLYNNSGTYNNKIIINN
ncbi:MAG: T9SS type A sorting domain-containing protein [Bacteroidia bacterium]|nr:T9SS type A sorting domain-containing protein [Bacteroidia bacterium]